MASRIAPFWSKTSLRSRNPGAVTTSLAVTVLLLGSAAASAAELRLLSIQPAQLAESGQRLRLTAAGRQLDLLLEPNVALVANGRLGDTQALRGTLPGHSGSWVRLTRRNGQYRGIYSDGAELYVVEQAAAVAAANRQAAALPPDTTVIYRLADLQIQGAVLEGDTKTIVRTAADSFAMVGAELASATALLATKRLDVAVLADTELVALDGASTDGKALDRLNVVDAIFSSQVGVQIRLGGVTHVDTAADSLSSTDPSTLIDQVGSYRLRTAAQQASGLTHLMTGRDLDGSTVGIAYMASLCSRGFSASLSEARVSVSFDGLIAAHEIGHVFGAPHDGDATTACSATPDNQYLMAPRMNGSSTFSDCSLQQVAPTVAAASCLAQISAPDAAISVPEPVPLALNQATAATFIVASVGTATVSGVAVTITPPASITLNSGTVTSGSCSTSGGALRCSLGDLGPGVQREVQLSLTGTSSGTASLALQLSATNDGLSTNNRSALTVVTAPGADLAATLSGDGSQVTIGQTATLRAVLRNLGLSAAPDATLSLKLPTGVTVTAVNGAGIACTISAGAVDCPAFNLAANAQATLDLTLRVDQAGSLAVLASLRSPTVTDPQPGNNSATATLTGVAAPTGGGGSGANPSGNSGGGGSGAALAGLVVLLLALQRAGRRYWPVLLK